MKPKRFDPVDIAEPFRGIFAHAVEIPGNANLLILSGQVGETDNGEIPDDFESQCRIAFDNVERILAAANMTFENIVKTTFYLTRPQDMKALIKVRKEKIDGVRPANTTLFVSQLMKPEWFVEIEVIAATTNQDQ